MKKLIITIALLLSFVAFVAAQPRAIGGRIGYGIDFSYQHQLGQNMLDIDLGFPGFNAISTVCTYNWIFPITSWEYDGSWNWYAGPGLGLGFHGFNLNENDLFPRCFAIGLAGRIGVEYNFWFPLQISVDYRPIISPAFSKNSVLFYTPNLWAGAFATSVRYIF